MFVTKNYGRIWSVFLGGGADPNPLFCGRSPPNPDPDPDPQNPAQQLSIKAFRSMARYLIFCVINVYRYGDDTWPRHNKTFSDVQMIWNAKRCAAGTLVQAVVCSCIHVYVFIAISINGSVGLLLFILQTVTITRYKNVWIEIKHKFTMVYIIYHTQAKRI